jgi:hypothetical protein
MLSSSNDYDCESGEDQVPLIGPDANYEVNGPTADSSITTAGRTFVNARFSEMDGPIAPSNGASQRAARKDWAIFLPGAAALVVCMLVGSFVFGSSPERGDVDSLANKGFLDTGLQAMQNIVDGMSQVSKIAGDATAAVKDTKAEWNALKSEAAAYGAVPTLSPAAQAALAAKEQSIETDVEKDLTPNENVKDGNICADDEELWSLLCYKKCAALTSGAFPLRSGPNQCCSAQTLAGCDVAHIQTSSTPCGGFEVSGDTEGKSGCPNPPGICLSNEEVYEGICYKKCEFLTSGIYPFRSGPDSCCKVDPTSTASNGFACFLGALNHDAKTNLAFGIGGGAGDGSPSTPDYPHSPLLSLTEASAVPAAPPAIKQLPSTVPR